MTGLVEQLQQGVGESLTIERELGGGGMSHVFVAHERTLGRTVVLKVLPPALANAINTERFRREVQLLARLQHTHIVPVLATGETNDMLYYTMPFVEGESLRHRLQRDGALPVSDTILILRDVLGALAYAHKRGVVHRDIKPENILLSEGGALVADFGIAKAMSDSGFSATLTRAGVIVGTPAYTAPEQAAGDPDVDARADLYALGAVAYEMLTGEQIFAGRAPHLQLAAHALEAPTPITAKRSELPPQLADLLMQALEKDPSRRPASAEAMLQVLDGVATAGGRIRQSAMTRPVTKRRRWPIVTAVIAAVLLILITAAFKLMPKDRLAIAKTLLHRRPAVLHVNRVVVAPFENQTGDASLGPIGAMAADWITDGLARLSSIQVVDARTVTTTHEVVRNIPRILRTRDDDRALAEETGAAVLVTGSYYRDSAAAGKLLRFQVRVLDLDSAHAQVRQTFTVDGPAAAPSKVIDALRDRVVVSMRQASDTTLSAFPGTYSPPPSVDAYEETRKGIVGYFTSDTSMFTHLRRGMTMDSTYTTPVVFLAFAAAYRSRFALADSALERLARMRTRLTPAERAMTDHIRAELHGSPDSALQAARDFDRLQPGSMEAPLLHASVAIERQRPHEARAALARTDPDRGLNLFGSFYWNYEFGAAMQLGEWKQALDYAREAEKRYPTRWGPLPAAAALVHLGKGHDALAEVLAAPFPRENGRVRTLARLSDELKLVGQTKLADSVAELALARAQRLRDTLVGRQFDIAFLGVSLGRWPQVLVVADSIAARPGITIDQKSTAMALRGAALAHMGRRDDALAIDAALGAMTNEPYAFGWPTYARARIAAQMGDETRAMALLKQALVEGISFGLGRPVFETDPLMMPVRGNAQLKQLLEPRD